MYKKRRNSVKSIQRLQEFKANSSIALEDLKCKELVLLLKKHNVDKSTINKMRTNVERVYYLRQLLDDKQGQGRTQENLKQQAVAVEKKKEQKSIGLFTRLNNDLLIAITHYLHHKDHGIFASTCSHMRLRLTLARRGTPSIGLSNLYYFDTHLFTKCRELDNVLVRMRNLRKLLIRSTSPTYIPKAITHLDCDSNVIKAMEAAGIVAKLEVLNLTPSYNPNTHISYWPTTFVCSNLRKLRLFDIAPQAADVLRCWPALEQLTLCITKFNSLIELQDVINMVAHLPRLEILTLEGVGFEEFVDFPQTISFAACTKLKQLYLIDTRFHIDWNTLPISIHSLALPVRPNNVDHEYHLTPMDVVNIGPKMANLRHLVLFGRNLGNIIQTAAKFPSITKISLPEQYEDACSGLAFALSMDRHNFKNLRSVVISRYFMTGDGSKFKKNMNAKLEELHIKIDHSFFRDEHWKVQVNSWSV